MGPGGRDKLLTSRVISGQGTGHVHPGNWAGASAGQLICQGVSSHYCPDRWGLALGICQWQECGPSFAAAKASQGRLLIPQNVELFLALSKEALEAKVLPDDWQQFLQQLPLPQTHYC